MKLRMRTKFLLSMLLISAGLTCTSLLLVRHSVGVQAKKSLFADLHNSVSTFQNSQRQRELMLGHSAELLADMPNLRALMTTQHAATIQDASTAMWRLGGSDLFVLANPSGTIVALHTTSPGFTREMAQHSLTASLGQPGPGHWWFGDHHLYEVFLKPIYFGPASEDRRLGFLAIGQEIDDSVSAQVSRIAASQVAFYYDDAIVSSTLTPSQESDLAHQRRIETWSSFTEPQEIQLGDEHFLGTSLELAAGKAPSVRLVVLKSYDQATAYLASLNQLLLVLGLAAVAGGSALVFLISHTFTRPLGSLVAGVRALGKGDFNYKLEARGGDEVAEVTQAFRRMRDSLLKTQQELLEAERLATIGRMASSISHDLRHSLAAIVANAEFLCESQLSAGQREDLYQEVRSAVNQMTDLIDSLLEFSRPRNSLRPVQCDVKSVVEHVLQMVRAHPEYHEMSITLRESGDSNGWFDPKKLERAILNLVLNACEAVAPGTGQVVIEIRQVESSIELRIQDNGRGIPEAIRANVFDPFVSSGKENGTGLGLTIVQKIIQDHGGEVVVESTSEEGTVFRVSLPIHAFSSTTPQFAGESYPAPYVLTKPVWPE